MNRSQLCVTVTAPSTAELRRQRDQVTDADLVELRIDTVADPDVAGALAGRRHPVIVTCRASWEGGGFKGSEEERRRLLRDALAEGAEYVDIEFSAGFDDLIAETGGRRLVLSSHDFDAVPADLPERIRAMRATGAEVVKIAGKASCLSDCLRFLGLNQNGHHQGRAVLIAMGDAGLSTRVLASRFGSPWTYAGTLEQIGQVSARTLVGTYRFRSVSPTTTLFGLTGSPIGHSVSPAMHNAAFRAAGLDAVYLPLPAQNPDDFVTFAKGIGLAGASVTIPFKVALAERLDHVDAAAAKIGAINTIRTNHGRWEGRNTDGAGFLQPLMERGIPLRGLRASLLGAGGSARAVAAALVAEGAEVTVHARDPQKAAQVARLTGAAVGVWPPPEGWELLVNCTPIGMHPKTGTTPYAAPLTGRYVYDLVYNPAETQLMKDAAAAGCQTIGGLEMLVGQAVEQFRWWTGVQPEVSAMRQAARERLAEFQHS